MPCPSPHPRQEQPTFLGMGGGVANLPASSETTLKGHPTQSVSRVGWDSAGTVSPFTWLLPSPASVTSSPVPTSCTQAQLQTCPLPLLHACPSEKTGGRREGRALCSPRVPSTQHRTMQRVQVSPGAVRAQRRKFPDQRHGPRCRWRLS